MRRERKPKRLATPILAGLVLVMGVTARTSLHADVGAPIPQSEEEQAEVRSEIEASKKEAGKEGLDLNGTFGANFSFNHNSNVVGQNDGALVNIGLLFDSGLLFRKRGHELRGGLSIQHTQTRTSSIGRFVKSLDAFEIKSLYLYHLKQPAWLSPFVSARLDTALFKGYAVRAEETTLQDVSASGENLGNEVTIPARERIELTDPFAPFVVKENGGFLGTPVETERIHFEVGLGLGGLHVFARNGRVLVETENDPVVKRVELSDSNQVGGVFQTALEAKLKDALLLTLNAEFMYPFYTDADTGGIDLLLNTELGAGLRVTLAKYVTLDYILSVKRIPLLLDKWQIQNGLLVNFAYNLF